MAKGNARSLALKKIPIAKPTNKIKMASAQMKKFGGKRGKGSTKSNWAGPSVTQAHRLANQGKKHPFAKTVIKGIKTAKKGVGKVGKGAAISVLPALSKGLVTQKLAGQAMKLGVNAL